MSGMFNPTLIGSPSPVGAGSSGGPTFIKRVFYKTGGTFTDIAPAGATAVDARAIGCGASYNGTIGGGGAAYSRGRLKCQPGQAVTVAVSTDGSAASQASAGGTQVTAGAGIVLAQNGSRDGAGGQASSCIGSVCRSGGYGTVPNGAAGAGDHGGSAGLSNASFGGGGGSAGDIGDTDSLLLGGNGASAASGGAGPGGGDSAGKGYGTGLVVLEYWSS